MAELRLYCCRQLPTLTSDDSGANTYANDHGTINWSSQRILHRYTNFLCSSGLQNKAEMRSISSMWKLSSWLPPTSSSGGNYSVKECEWTAFRLFRVQVASNRNNAAFDKIYIWNLEAVWSLTLSLLLDEQIRQRCLSDYSTLFFIKTWCKQVWKPLQCFISAPLPFLGLHLPSEMRVKGQPLSPDYWDHMRVTESGIYGVGHVSFALQLSQIPLWRPGPSWLTGVSNDSRSEVTSQRKHTGLAQLQADLTSPRTVWYGKRLCCLLKTDDLMHSN